MFVTRPEPLDRAARLSLYLERSYFGSATTGVVDLRLGRLPGVNYRDYCSSGCDEEVFRRLGIGIRQGKEGDRDRGEEAKRQEVGRR